MCFDLTESGHLARRLVRRSSRQRRLLRRVIATDMRKLSTAFALLMVLALGQVGSAESFHLKRVDGVLVLPVQINHSITLNFTIDSGASDVVIPQDVFSTLKRTGTITSRDMLPSEVYELANGTRYEAKRFRIRSLQIEHLELKNVTGSVAPTGGSLLLGQSFLSRLPGWSIDNQREVLIVGDASDDGEEASSRRQHDQLRNSIDAGRRWLACAAKFNIEAKGEATIRFDNQLAMLYPRFGLLWNEWANRVSTCSQLHGSADSARCGADALSRAHAEFVERVASTAEPDAVREFNTMQTLLRLATDKMTQTCGSPP